jgi:SAM-dependent methyltransferase
LLACPECHGELSGVNDALSCLECGAEWTQREGWLDFRTRGRPDEVDWQQRQRAMEDWYENLFTNSDAAKGCYAHDYEPLAPLLGELRGLILDVGGGNGIARQFLHPDADYMDLDPSPLWLREDWLGVSSSFPGLLSPITFVLGVGERLPIRSASVDAVISLFSINHSADPERVVSESRRVLRTGGRLLVVAEDMEPRWLDLTRRGFRDGWVPMRTSLRHKLATAVARRDWPVASDHVRMTEPDLRSWLGEGFGIERRTWVGGYLALAAVKRG